MILPIFKPDDPVEVVLVPVFMRDHHDRLVELFIDLFEQFKDKARIFRIKV
ncbi:MAG: hypothetical protein Q7V05_08080 [Methanoregula sp.]|nr:hypothetical protein [Methanoregula sp.]